MTLVVRPRSSVRLDRHDPRATPGFTGGKDEGLKELSRQVEHLERLQELLFADGRHRLLVVLQGMDTSGKDGVIRHVFDGMNPQGVTVANFRQPTPIEAAHDFLWRIHAHVPMKGQVAIFNRSHYEDVLVVRVHGAITGAQCARRLKNIVAFEEMLANEGVTIVKFFLHISKGEQKRRFLDRVRDPQKRWKFNLGDLSERKHWAKYMRAYEDALGATSTAQAPWYIIPADHKWYRNLAIARIILQAMTRMDLRYPRTPKPADIKIR